MKKKDKNNDSHMDWKIIDHRKLAITEQVETVYDRSVLLNEKTELENNLLFVNSLLALFDDND